MSSSVSHNVIARTLLRLASTEAVVGTAVVLVWCELLELSAVWLIATLFGLRLALESVHLLSLLGPVQRWQHGEQSDADLRAADAAVHRTPTRLLAGSLINWVVLLGVALVLADAGIGSERAPGPTELSLGGLIIVSGLISLPVLIAPSLQAALLDIQTELSTVALARHIDLRRGATSLVGSIVSSVVLNACACIIGVGASAGLYRIDGVRDVAVGEQRRLAELAAKDLEHGEALPDETSLELLAAAQLPSELAAAAPEPETGVRLAFDRRAQTAWAAVPIEAGTRFVVAHAPTTEQGGAFALVLVGLTVLIATPAMVGAYSLARSITTPLTRLEQNMRGFVERGELEQLRQVVPLRNDELGRLGHSVRDVADLLESLATAARTVARGDLRVGLDHPGELHEAFRAMVEQLREMVARIREAAIELAGTAAEIHASTRASATVAEQQSLGAREASESVASLAAAATDITTVANRVLGNAERALATNDDMVAQITALRRNVAGVGELLEAIREVANRSDLLALNGSLEATRAGETGRGFALVAAEMRRLAERVTGTVAAVHELVDRIEASGSTTIVATEANRALVESTAAAAREISSVTDRQGQDTRVVSQTIQEVSAAVMASAAALEQTRAAAEGLRAQAELLQELTGRFELNQTLRPTT